MSDDKEVGEAKRAIQTIILKDIAQWLRVELGDNYRTQAHPGMSADYPSMLMVYRSDINADISFNFGQRRSSSAAYYPGYTHNPGIRLDPVLLTNEFVLDVGDVRYNGTRLTTNMHRANKRMIPVLDKGSPLCVMLEDPKSVDLIQQYIMRFTRKYIIQAEALLASVKQPPPPVPLIPPDLFKWYIH